MEPADRTPAQLFPLPQPPAPTEWWLVAPSPMEFENIGFSKAVAPGHAGKQLKLLLCAQRNLGPLGWSEVRNRILAGVFQGWVPRGLIFFCSAAGHVVTECSN
ncbi:hypothetical protein C8R47DRAFT_227567 [Mycena vitilis]|nr:hypothetical protein C8R47DRAFT_227567 [Mycena vitilis]